MFGQGVGMEMGWELLVARTLCSVESPGLQGEACSNSLLRAPGSDFHRVGMMTDLPKMDLGLEVKALVLHAGDPSLISATRESPISLVRNHR